MDKQLEQRIRERAYELWMQHGSLPGRADEYWYQAEREILGEQDGGSKKGAHPVVGRDEAGPLETGSTVFGRDEAGPLETGSTVFGGDEAGPLETGSTAFGRDEEAPVETNPAPLGMTSQTLDEVLSSPAAPKTRRRKSTAAEVTESVGETVAAPKRRRVTKPTT